MGPLGGRGVRAAVVCGVALVLAGCGEQAEQPVAARAPAGASPRPDPGLQAEQTLRRRFIQDEQAAARGDARFALVADAAQPAGQLIGHNPPHGLTLSFGKRGAGLRSTQGWQLGLSAQGLRCDERVVELPEPEPAVRDAENRALFRRRIASQHFDEWYVNGPLGLEQGFTLGGSPCSGEATALTLEVGVAGLTPKLETEQRGVERQEVVRLVDADDSVRAVYSDWFAHDANEQPLGLQVTTEQGRIVLRVDLSRAVFPVTIDPIVWTEQKKVSGPAGSFLGGELALSGNSALVAGEDGVYVYVSSGGNWTLQQQLGTVGFGSALAIEGNTAVVGDYYANEGDGAAYVYVRSGSTWTLQETFLGGYPPGGNAARLGASVALSGNTLLVGVPGFFGHVRVFVRSGSTWSKQQELVASDTYLSVGSAVALSGDLALVGAASEYSTPGAVYMFERSGTVWTEKQRFLPSDSAINDRFGYSLALSGSTLLVGSRALNSSLGGAYVFTRSAGTWSEQQKLSAPGDFYLGSAIALLDDTALVGGVRDGIGTAFTWGRSGTVWTQQTKLQAGDAQSDSRFGEAVALAPRLALVGSAGVEAVEHRGAFYVFGSGLAQGDPCTTDGECSTGHCAEQVCCDTTCLGTCNTCLKSRKASGADGTCGNVKVGTDPLNQCTMSAVSTCGLNGNCNGSGACQYYATGTECAPASCPTSRSENRADSCNGSHACVVTATMACGKGYVCAGGACSTSCAADGECDQAAGYSCIGGECLIAKGSACKAGDVCETGHCADGVCCDAACNGVCSACLLSLTGEPDGSCAVIPAGQDPEEECPIDPGYPQSCGADGACNGAGLCREYGIAGTPCGAPTMCTADEVSGELCNGTGTCTNDTVDCGVYPCDAAMVACATSCKADADCSDIAYCITSGTCTKRKPNGGTCTEARECASQQCVDGVCCESACAGQCAFCAEAGSQGECLAVTGEPRGARAACDGDGGACQGSCDGVNPAACSFPGATTVCGRACSGETQEQLSHCDGDGACSDDEPSTCGGYLCRGDRCLSECADDADCKNGYGCNMQQCVAKSGRCNEDNTMSHTNDGLDVPCAPYVCDAARGACLTECNSSDQCGVGFACNAQTHTCQATGSATDDDGCACRAAGGRSPGRSGAGVLWLLGLGSLLAVRRFRGQKALALLTAACGLLGCTDGAPQVGSTDPVPHTTGTLAASHLGARQQAKQALRQTRIRDQQSSARDDRRYTLGRPEHSSRAPLTGHNPAFGMALSFGKAGVELEADQDFRLRMTASALRCGEQTHALDPVPARVGDQPNHVVYARQVDGQSLQEWYVNGPLGLEQGFTLAGSPCSNAATLIGIDIELAGLRPELAGDPMLGDEYQQVVALVDAHGTRRALYSDWFAYDANQRQLPIQVSTEEGRLHVLADVSGAAFPVTIDPLIWTEKKKLVASDRVAGVADYYGTSVALEGNTALIGASADNSYQGAAYVHVRSGAVWTQQQKLLGSAVGPGQWFGHAVGLSGNTAIVGSYQASNGGAAYVFVRSGSTWTEQKKLAPSDAAPALRFGYSVAVSGDTALVGAPSAVAAYVFVRSGSTWTEQKKLAPSDTGVEFGSAVALSGDTALVGDRSQAGAIGAAYVFVRSGSTWTEQKKLTPSNGAANDMFASSLALSGETAVVGAPFRASNKGSAYVFVRSGTIWTEQKELTGSDSVANDVFGWSTAVSGNTAAVGARGDESNTGAVYVFGRTGTTWSEKKKLTASDGGSLDNLGISVALSGDVVADRQYDVLAGSQYDDSSLGAAYVFGMAYEDADACTKDEDCASQHCVENVCCNTACTGTCKTCLASRKASGQDGVCGDVKVNTDPRNVCATSAVATCGFEGTCNGSGACKFYPAGTECAAATCPSATSENPADTCNGSGTCSVAAEKACAPGYLCAGGACKTSCNGNADCNTAAGYECTGDKCLIPLGLPCTPEDSCATGHCVDGVCCVSACDGACSACTNNETGQPDGTCAFALGGRDPRNECELDAEYPTSCREDGTCDGQGACRQFAVSGTACGESTCAAGTISGDICDGAGKCAQASEECAPYVCDGDSCSNSCAIDQDCDEQVAYCINGTCNAKKTDAAACTESHECLSGACADGVCCDRACSGQCEACNANGVCQVIEGPPQGGREACTGAGTACVGVCDGSDGLACSYPSPATECGRACVDARATISTCDGAGSCVEGNPVSCESYACSADRCLSQCASDVDCQDGFACKASECVAKGSKCIEGGAKSQSNADDSISECAPYLCEVSSGECLTTCRSSNDCDAGYLCNAEAKACQLPTAAPPEDSGCGCRAAGGGARSSPGGMALLLAGLGVVFVARRRRLQRPQMQPPSALVLDAIRLLEAQEGAPSAVEAG